MVERSLGKTEVLGSKPRVGSEENMAFGLTTYPDSIIRKEDLLDIVKGVKPQQAGFKSGLKTLLDSVIEDEKTKRNNNKEKLKNLLKSV